MRATRLRATAGGAAIALTAAFSDAQAQYDGSIAPRISVSTMYGGAVSSNYIEPSIHLSEDAYVFAIAVDLDGSIRVLQPEYPGIAVRMNSRRSLHLPRFFAGYGNQRTGVDFRSGTYASRFYGYDPGYSDTRGTIIALASRRPFNFDAITRDGDWNTFEIARLLGARYPQSAGLMLAKLLGARGEPIGRDFYRFSGGGHHYTSYYNTPYYGCNPAYSALGGFPGYGGISFFRARQLEQAGYRVSFIGFDPCGTPRYTVHSQNVTTGPSNPPATGAFPPSRRSTNVPRNPGREQPVSGGSAGSSTRTADEFPDRWSPRTSPSGRAGGRTLPPDRARGASGSFPSGRTRAEPAEPRQRTEPARVTPPPQRSEPRERPQPPAAPPREPERKPVP